jgi:hypothetical protein
MDRRTALKSITAGLAASTGGFFITERAEAFQLSGNNFGWRPNRRSLENFIRKNRYPYISQQNREIKGTGEGKKAFLHLALERVMGREFVPHDQGAPDCVSQASALGVDILSAVQVAVKRYPQRWVGKTASEPIYGGSRIEVGGYRGMGGGSTGHWAAEWLTSYGTLLRQKYPGGYDFSVYDAEKAVEYGYDGCPDPLEPLTKLHPVKKTAICNSWSNLRDCLYNGKPVMVCSNVGFGSNGVCVRDSEGFLTRKRSPWYHAMLFAGFDDEYRRPGALCFNSWGYSWIEGPTRGPQPAGTFWVDADTVDAMLRQGDSFAFSAYVGFPRLVIPPYILR